MFARSSVIEPKPLAPVAGAARGLPRRPHPVAAKAGANAVIGNDPNIIGYGPQVRGPSTLALEGQLHCDVGGAEPGAVIVARASPCLAGDIPYAPPAIAWGAESDGRCRRAADASQFAADLPC
jgi:hypothetical protein